jgi:hypothetical protein
LGLGSRAPSPALSPNPANPTGPRSQGRARKRRVRVETKEKVVGNGSWREGALRVEREPQAGGCSKPRVELKAGGGSCGDADCRTRKAGWSRDGGGMEGTVEGSSGGAGAGGGVGTALGGKGGYRRGAEKSRAGLPPGGGVEGPPCSPACLVRRREDCGQSGLRGAGGSQTRVGHGAWSGGLVGSKALELEVGGGRPAGARGAGRRREMLASARLRSAPAALASAGLGTATWTARSPPLPRPSVGHARFNPSAAVLQESSPVLSQV